MDSIKKNKDFRIVYKYGKSYATRNLVLYTYKNRNNKEKNRYGFSISKKIGKAVIRNKLKRRLKELVKQIDSVKQGYDLIFIARKPLIHLEFNEIKRDVLILFKKAGLYKG